MQASQGSSDCRNMREYQKKRAIDGIPPLPLHPSSRRKNKEQRQQLYTIRNNHPNPYITYYGTMNQNTNTNVGDIHSPADRSSKSFFLNNNNSKVGKKKGDILQIWKSSRRKLLHNDEENALVIERDHCPQGLAASLHSTPSSVEAEILPLYHSPPTLDRWYSNLNSSARSMRTSCSDSTANRGNHSVETKVQLFGRFIQKENIHSLILSRAVSILRQTLVAIGVYLLGSLQSIELLSPSAILNMGYMVFGAWGACAVMKTVPLFASVCSSKRVPSLSPLRNPDSGKLESHHGKKRLQQGNDERMLTDEDATDII